MVQRMFIPEMVPASLVACLLSVVEIGRDGDNRAVDGCSEVGFGSLLHLEEYHQRDFFG
jgi:hypothetical protein